jgi:uncharacterized protein YcfJ
MEHLKLAPIAASCCLAVAALQLHAQPGDWEAVKQLAPGTPISVVKRLRQQCELVRVTDWELTCEWDMGRVRKLVFARDDVRQVRLEYPDQHHALAGALAGAAAGALIGFGALRNASDPEARGYGRAYGAPIGALFGGVIGRNFHRHGAIVYQRR